MLYWDSRELATGRMPLKKKLGSFWACQHVCSSLSVKSASHSIIFFYNNKSATIAYQSSKQSVEIVFAEHDIKLVGVLVACCWILYV